MTDSPKKTSSGNDINGLLNDLSHPLALLSLVVLVVMAIILRDVWGAISGLYFPWAFNAIFMPYIMVGIWTLYEATYEKVSVRRTVHLYLLLAATVLLYSPALYLVITGQMDSRGLVLEGFDPSLQHMPYASYLPIVAYVALLYPLVLPAKRQGDGA